MKTEKDVRRLCTWWSNKIGRITLSELNPVMVAECLNSLSLERPYQKPLLGCPQWMPDGNIEDTLLKASSECEPVHGYLPY